MEAKTLKVFTWALVLLFCSTFAAANTQATNKVSVQEARQIAEDAYIYGYPLITMEMTRRVMTNVREPEGTRGPMGHLLRIRSYPTAAFKDVTAPNADTLYTTAWLDVGKEPWILSLPDAHDRYYLFPMLDGWMAGPMYFRYLASVPPAPAHRNTPSPAPAGRASSLRV